MMDPPAKLHAGYPPLMPTYLGRLSGAEAAAIVEYIRSLRSAADELDTFWTEPRGVTSRGCSRSTTSESA